MFLEDVCSSLAFIIIVVVTIAQAITTHESLLSLSLVFFPPLLQLLHFPKLLESVNVDCCTFLPDLLLINRELHHPGVGKWVLSYDIFLIGFEGVLHYMLWQ